MHWTLQTSMALCAACLVLNALQYRMVGTVRVAGMLVCGFWALQEIYWASFGDSLLLFAACDAALVVWLVKCSGLDWSDRVAVALVPATFACGIYAWINGHTVTSWWLNWSLVTAQMVLSLPRPKLQRIIFSITHGPLGAKSPAQKAASGGYNGDEC